MILATPVTLLAKAEEDYTIWHIIHDLIASLGNNLALALIFIAILAVCLMAWRDWLKKFAKNTDGIAVEKYTAEELNEKHREIITKTNHVTEELGRIEGMILNEIARMDRIEKKLNENPLPCMEHDGTKGCLLDVKDMVQKMLTILMMQIKGNFLHKHSDDGKSITIPSGLEELLNANRDYFKAKKS